MTEGNASKRSINLRIAGSQRNFGIYGLYGKYVKALTHEHEEFSQVRKVPYFEALCFIRMRPRSLTTRFCALLQLSSI